MDPKRKNLPQRVDMTGNIVSKRRSSVQMAKEQSYKVVRSADEDDDSNDEEGSDTFSEKVFKILDTLMGILEFVPLLLLLFVSDYKIAVTAALGVAIFNMCFSYFMYKMGKTRSWPKIIDLMFLILFFAMTVSIWTKPETIDFWYYWNGPISSFFLFFFVVVAWAFGCPFAKTFMEDEYGIIGSTHPFCQFCTRVVTGTWAAVFFIIGVIGLPCGILQAIGKTPSYEFFVMMGWISCIPFILGMLISYVGLPWYINKYEDKIFEKHETEIMAWMVKYPDEKFTKMYEEEMEAEKEKAVGNSDAQDDGEVIEASA